MKILFYFFVGLLLPLFIFERVTRKFVNPYKLYFLVGSKGSGKTTLETKIAYKGLKGGWHVYTDLPELFIPGIRLYKSKDLGDFVPEADSILIIGEAGTKFDKRHFKTFPDSLRDFFVFQRKYKVIVYMDSQSYDIDSKIRDRVDGMYLCVKIARIFSVAKRITTKIRLVESTAEANSRIAEDLCYAPFFMWKFTYLPRWINRFDSDAIIDKKPYLEYTVVGEDPAPERFEDPADDYCPISDDSDEALRKLNEMLFG